MSARDEAPSLAELQARLWRLITAREEAREALEKRGLPPAFIESFVEGDERLDAVGRVDIYNGMYFLRILDSLAEDFPAVRAAIGEDAFYDLVADYLEALPPQKPSLRWTSERLPGFVAGHDLAESRPWLADLAALEWARVDVFDATDATTLTLEALQSTPPDALAALPLRAVPTHRLVPVAHAVEETWGRAIHDELAGDALGAPPASAGHLIVWRPTEGASRTYHRRLVPPEATLWPDLQAGTTFGRMCERLGEGREPEEAAQLAAALLGRWAHESVLATGA